MRRIGSVAAGLALLGAVAACADRPEQVGFGGQPELARVPAAEAAAPPQTAGWPSPPPGAREIPSSQVDRSGLPEGYPGLAWTEGDGRTLGAYGQEGGCTEVHPEVREQTPQAVRLAMVEVTSSPGPCTMDLRFPPVTAGLDAPVGERTVILERHTVGPQGR